MIRNNRILSTKIASFERELNDVKSKGYIHTITPIKKLTTFSGGVETIGSEILFLDTVTDKQINKIITYIEREYNFLVLNFLIEAGKIPKILLIQYSEIAI
jgi:hypothetical protein